METGPRCWCERATTRLSRHDSGSLVAYSRTAVLSAKTIYREVVKPGHLRQSLGHSLPAVSLSVKAIITRRR